MSFEKYSLSELSDIYNHIDSDKYPEKYKQVESRIEELKNRVEFTSREFTIVSDRMAKWMGISQILIGIVIVTELIYLSLSAASSFEGNIIASIMVSIFASSFLIGGGIYLFKSQKMGGWISAISMLFFTISFQISSVVYSLITGIALNVGISSFKGLFISFEFGKFILNVGKNDGNEFLIGLNIFALVYLLIAVSYKTYYKYPDNYIEI